MVHDGSSYISIAIWENINLTNDDYYYEITDVIVSDYYHEKNQNFNAVWCNKKEHAYI